VLRELGGSAGGPSKRSASGGQSWNRWANLNARLTGDPTGGDRNATRQHGDTTRRHCNASGWNRDAAGYTRVHIPRRNSKHNSAKL
jgi:hypothetical protein